MYTQSLCMCCYCHITAHACMQTRELRAENVKLLSIGWIVVHTILLCMHVCPLYTLLDKNELRLIAIAKYNYILLSYQFKQHQILIQYI